MFSMFAIAHEYATAIFDIALARKNVSEWELVLNLFSKISQNSLMQSLCFRRLEPKILSDIFLAVCEDCQKNQIDVFGKNLIRIMSENNRLLLLPIVLKEFICIYAKYMRTMEIKVISAWPLQSKQLEKITDMMSVRFSAKVNLEHSIDKSILSGIIIYVGDTIIDGSILGRISRLNDMLQS